MTRIRHWTRYVQSWPKPDGKRRIVGYCPPDKGKGRLLLDAFACGCQGRTHPNVPAELESSGDAVFYGVWPDVRHLWEQAKQNGRDWYMIDNAYTDRWRGFYFRITKGRMQHTGIGHGSASRFREQRIQILRWRRGGTEIVVCPQSNEFMRDVAKRQDWLAKTVATLKQHTDRPIVVRGPDIAGLPPFHHAISNAHAIVTWTSCSAVNALFLGVPVFVLGEDSIARPYAETDITKIETPRYDVDREQLGRLIAANQWTVEEIKNGLAWKMLNA